MDTPPRKKLSPDEMAYDLLTIDTLHHADEHFVHQFVVDIYTAQTATSETKPITIAMALVGLYLHVEHHFSGRQVQEVHMQLASLQPEWPAVTAPEARGSITASMVMKQPHGEKRNHMIDLWAAAVWFAWKDSHQTIKDFVQAKLGIQ